VHRTTALLLAMLATAVAAGGATAHRAGAPPARIVFPVVGPTTFYDDFGEPRGSGVHQGNDVVAERHTPVVAVEGGTVTVWTKSRGAGCMLYLHGRSGTTYLYVHLNNDLTNTNDNRGGCVGGVAYAPGLHDGQAVRAGELLGFVGDSGDADGIHAHLHFELHPGGGAAVSPYWWLRRARRLLYAAPNDAPLPLSLTLIGKVRSAAPSPAGQRRLSMAVRKVSVSNGWTLAIDRAVVLRVPPEAVVEYAAPGGPQPAALEDATVGQALSATVEIDEPTLKSQLAAPGALAAARLQLQS
jgi:hypothetical protein